MRKHFSYVSGHLLFASLPNFMFFRHRSWSPFFDNLVWFCSKIVDLRTPSKSSRHQNPPTLAGVRRCQTRECRLSQDGQNLSLGPWFSSLAADVAPKVLLFWFGGPPFASTKKHQKPNPSKSQKIPYWTPKALILMTCWRRLDLHLPA